MKFEPELVRAILEICEASPGRPPTVPEVAGFTGIQVQHHVWLMERQGLVRAADDTADDSPTDTAMLLGMEPAGHAFLAAARNDVWWRQALRGAGAFSLQALQAALLAALAGGTG